MIDHNKKTSLGFNGGYGVGDIQQYGNEVYMLNIQGQKPDGGFWYCEELKTGIDFDLYQTTTQCVKVYHDDGNIQTNGCHTDYGVGICFFTGSVSNNTYNEYFHGTFRYNKEKEQFIIESYPDGIIYIFVKQ